MKKILCVVTSNKVKGGEPPIDRDSFDLHDAVNK